MLTLGDDPRYNVPPIQLIGYDRGPSTWRYLWLRVRDVPATLLDRIGGDEIEWAYYIGLTILVVAALVLGCALLAWAGRDFRVA